MENQKSMRRRLVLIPCPFQGHINPMFQLGTILHSRGFSITIAHSRFSFPDTSNHHDFTFLPLSDGSPYKLDDFISFISNLNLNCRAPLQDVLTRIIEQQEEHELPPCIIYDGLLHFAEAVACNLKLPSIILHTVSAQNLLTYHAYPWLREEGYIPLQDYKSQELVPGFYPLRFRDLLFSDFEDIDALLQVLANFRDVRSSSGIIWNTMERLEKSSLEQLKQQYKVPIFSIGPMHKISPASSSSLLKEDTSCLEWLDRQTPKSVIYISFGSTASVDEKELAEMAWGIANSKQPFLWVIRPGLVRGTESMGLLPDGFKETVGERGCIVKWAPQKEVLAHNAVGGFWSHSGWNSTLESISEGVPMICRPSLLDQRVNARYISHVWRIGLELENDLERGEIERAIKRMMVGKEEQEMRLRALDLKEKAEACVREGGSSYNSLNELVEFIASV